MQLAGLLQKWLTGGPMYVQLKPDLLSVRDIGQRRTIEERPIVALSADDTASIIAIGSQAETKASASAKPYTLINPFDHPRTILADFNIAEKLLQHFVRELAHNSLIRPSPVMIMHPLGKTEGGLTQVEVRALQELAMGSGAREAVVWTGKELSDIEIESNQYPGDHWLPSRPKWANH